MSDFTPPNINSDNLGFDDFHPLDHTLIECTGYPGGRRRHLAHWWEFFARPWLRTHTLCRLGLHTSTLFKGRNDPHTDDWYVWDGCPHCLKRLSQPQPI